MSTGTFTVSNGSAGLAGSIIVGAGAGLALAGQVANSGTIAGAGTIRAGAEFDNSGTVNGSGAAGLTLNASGGFVANSPSGLIEATAAGGLTIARGTISNAGTMLAANGGTLRFLPVAVNTANSGGTPRGGTWEVVGKGSVLAVTGGAVVHDNAAIILSGAGSSFVSGAGSTFSNLRASLIGILPWGTLELDAGAAFSGTSGISDFGLIRLGGGTLTLPRLAVASYGQVRGSGTIADFRYAITNNGTIEAQGGTLDVATAVDPGCSGVFMLDAASVLEIAADQGSGDRIHFVGASGELVVDAVGKFGLHVGSAAYTGPLVENFASGDSILLKDLAPAGLTPVYNAASGILQISNGSASVASLAFATASLGAGSFHLGDDGHGHAVLTHA